MRILGRKAGYSPRTRMLATAVGLASLVLAAADVACGEEPVIFAPAYTPRAVRYKLQVEGQLQTTREEGDSQGNTKKDDAKKDDKGSDARVTPMRIQGEFLYLEQTADELTVDLWGRTYGSINAELTIGARKLQPTLREDVQQHAVNLAGDRVQRVAAVPMTSAEDQLVAHVFDTALLERLLPNQPVSEGDRWPIDDVSAAMLLGLDHAVENELEAVLQSIEDGAAEIRVEGEFRGAALDVEAEMRVRARLKYDLERQRFSWAAIGVKDHRPAGAASPGVDAVSTITIKLGDAERRAWRPPTPEQLAAVRLEHRFEDEGISVVYDPRWRVTFESPESAVFRLIDDGEFIAQGRAVVMPRVKAGSKSTIKQFQDDVQKTLGDRFAEFASASEQTTSSDAHLLECTAVGTIDELSIQWMYFLATGRDGRRLALTFTAQPDAIERIAGADREMAESARFLTLKVASKPEETTQLNLESTFR